MDRRYLDEINFLYNVLDNYEYDIFYHSGVRDALWDIDDEFEDENKDICFSWASGASKVVFITDDHVIKVGITENYVPDEWESCLSDYHNYCELEHYIYERAVAAGIEFLFARTEYVGQINGTAFYMQELAESYSDSDIGYSKHYSDEEHRTLQSKIDSKNAYTSLSDNWLLDVQERYGEEVLFKLLEFIRENHITDLHQGNFGYAVADHRPILIDFSGFESYSWTDEDYDDDEDDDTYNYD